MLSQEEIHEKNLHKILNEKWEQQMLLCDERCKKMDARLTDLQNKITLAETIFAGQYKQMNHVLQKAYEARENLKEVASGADKEILNMIKELGVLINKWRGYDY